MKPFHTIIVGLGRQSLVDHLPSLLRRKDILIVGVCDPDPKARKMFRQQFPQLKDVLVAKDLRELLDNGVKPNFAIVAVPHNHYPETIRMLCTFDIPFIKEKPLARDIAEAQEFLSYNNFRKYGFIATQRRYSNLYNAARKSLEDIGEPYLFNITYTLNILDPQEGWRGQRSAAGGGCLLDMGYHAVDHLLWWFGMPEKLHAQVSTMAASGSYDAEDSATVSFGYNDGLHGTFLISRAAGEKRETYEVYGSKGYIVGSKKGYTAYNREGQVVASMSEQNSNQMIDGQLGFFLGHLRDGRDFADIQKSHLNNMAFIQRCYSDALGDTIYPMKGQYAHV